MGHVCIIHFFLLLEVHWPWKLVKILEGVTILPLMIVHCAPLILGMLLRILPNLVWSYKGGRWWYHWSLYFHFEHCYRHAMRLISFWFLALVFIFPWRNFVHVLGFYSLGLPLSFYLKWVLGSHHFSILVFSDLFSPYGFSTLVLFYSTRCNIESQWPTFGL